MFCHLRVHSEYSLLRSTIKLKELVEKTRAYGMKSVALTDYFVMHGAINFYKEASLAGIKPVIGIELIISEKDYPPYNIVLLAKNLNGYRNLCKVSSLINLKDRSDRYNISFKDIQDLCKHTICLIGYENNLTISLLLKNRIKEAEAILDEWSGTFGSNLFFELQRPGNNACKTGYPDIAAKKYREYIFKNFAGKKGIGIVATNNVSFLSKEDYCAFKAFFKIYTMSSAKIIKQVKDEDLEECYFKTRPEMKNLFKDLHQALENTITISGQCDLVLDFKKITAFCSKNRSEKYIKNTDKSAILLRETCYHKARLIYGRDYGEDIKKRLEYELGVIEETGFSRYFLIVSDIADYARKNNIPICGKGSSAGSLVVFILGISNIDPLINNLSFERFLHRQRKKLPDIDIDISSTGRDKISRYLSSKYGLSNVVRVPIFTRIGTRSSLRESGRVFNLGRQEIELAISDFSLYRHNTNLDTEKSGPDYSDKNFIKIASSISGFIRHISMHPCAFAIIDNRYSDMVPLMLSETGDIMSQYSAENIESMGFLKIDLIKSVTLDHIDEISKVLARTRGIYLDFTKIPANDKKVFRSLSEGNSLCVFQLESMGIRALMKKLKPASLEDITLLLSLYRPGPQQSGMVEAFIKRKFKEEPVDYMHHDLKPVLDETYGVILYQEQVMKVAEKIAGYSPYESDRLRRSITDLSRHDMENERQRFLEGALKKGYEHKLSVKIFNLIAKFAGYGFVKAHAAAYAGISYITAYIKAYFPAELIAAVLSRNAGYYNKETYIEEARRLGIQIKPPDINLATDRYTTGHSGKTLMVSLLAVKDLGAEGVKKIIREREKNGKYENFFDFYERIVKKKMISIKAAKNLICAGAFDFTGLKRRYLTVLLEYLGSLKTERKGFPVSTLNKNINYENVLFPEVSNALQEYKTEEKIRLESSLLGFSLTCSPLDYFKKITENLKVTDSLLFKQLVCEKNPLKSGVITEGFIITKRKEILKNKEGKEIIFLTLEDRGGMYEAVSVSQPSLKICTEIKPGTPVLLKGALIFKRNDIYVRINQIASLAELKRIREEKLKDTLKIQILKNKTDNFCYGK